MVEPDDLLRTLRRAIRAFQNTPGRRGRFVRLEQADEVLVGGDMHGNLHNFQALVEHADLATHPNRHLIVQELVHGPFLYPEGGEQSHQLLDYLAEIKNRYPRQVHMLLGNHELAQWTGQPITKSSWSNSGKNPNHTPKPLHWQTMWQRFFSLSRSFAPEIATGQDLNLLFREGVGRAYQGRAAEVYNAYLELFAVLPLAIRTPNRVFLSHSLPSESRLPEFQLTLLERDIVADYVWRTGGILHALVWGRDTRPETAAQFLRQVDADLLITGHIPCDDGFSVPNDRQLILDSMGWPAGYCLFPANQPLTHEQLLACVHTL
ncbi:MAG: metallophosphoesterase [Gemmataceae bacterium]